MLGQVIEVCIREKWLSQCPFRVKWKKLAKKPRKARLISAEELNHLCKLAIQECPARGKVFADYLETFSLTGDREKETLTMEWDKHIIGSSGSLNSPAASAAGDPRQRANHGLSISFSNWKSTCRTCTNVGTASPRSCSRQNVILLNPPKHSSRRGSRLAKKMAFLELIKTLASTTHDIILSATLRLHRFQRSALRLGACIIICGFCIDNA